MAIESVVLIPYPTTDEVAQALGQLHAAEARVAERKAKLAQDKAALDAQYAADTEKDIATVKGLRSDIEKSALARRVEWLMKTPGKSKTLKFPTGSIGYRDTPPSIEVDDDDKAIAELKKRDLDGFIITREFIDKESLLKTPDLLKGCKHLRITSGTTVTIKAQEARDDR